MGNFDRTSSFYTIFKMEVTTWLSLLLAVIALGTTASASEPRVVCYYTNWSVYRPGTAKFNPQNINPYLCTHLVYAFGGFTKDNTFKPFDKYQDIEKGGYAKFTGLKTYNKNLKTMLAIGGWNEGSSRFSPMVGSRERRKEFVRNAIKFLRQNRFDGLDLDWEYPAFRDGGKPKDRENYAKLVKELREEFDRESEKTGKPRLLLTMAVPAGIEYIQKGFDVKTLNRYLDWMNLLSYDYHSAFEPAVNHHAPLYPLEEPNEYSVDNELNIDYTIKFYIESGADPSKLVLGIPTYGRSYTLFNPDAVEIGSPADGPGEQGDATREKGYLAYYEICESLKPKEKKKKRQASEEDSEEYSDEEEEEEDWTVMHPNPEAMGPVAYRGNQWVGYDDVDIVRKKAEFVAENGLGGIMFWSIDNDDFRGTCHGKPYPLIEAAKESYFAKLGTSSGNVIKEKVSTSTRRKNRPRSSTTTTTTTPKPSSKSNKRKPSSSVTSTTPAWNIITPEPPTTPDPGSDFKCVDEGFYPHPRDCKKYFWCLDSGPSNLGIVAHQFTCPSGLFFNKAADSCDFARNVLCKNKDPPAAPPTTRAPSTRPVTTTTTTTTRKPIRLSTKSSSLFRTTSTTTPEPEEEEYEDESREEPTDEDAEDPRVLKELIDLIKKVGGIEQLEKQLRFGENNQASTGGASTTTPSPFKKKLYQKVLERTRGQNRYTGPNSILENAGQNSRRGPQSAGIETSNDKDQLIRKDRPQYVTINRQRGSKVTTEATPESEESEDESEEEVQPSFRPKSADTQSRFGTTTKPLQYVNIRRARPTTSDTADDTASRNALFERSEPFVTVSDTPNSLDILSARRENQPEYVTIRRQRPTTEETSTVQYQNSEEEEELQETALEREISTQPQYTSIVRSRSTARPIEEPSSEAPVHRVRSTTVATEETSSPDPTTVLSVQISSLLNSPNSAEIETTETESPAPTTVVETTTPTTTTTTTTTTPAPPSLPTRRTVIRRRGSTTPSPRTAAPSPSTTASSSITQVSPRNYTFVNRRRPLPRPNEISSDSDDSTDSSDVSRKIRSTTPDSREVDETIPRETGPVSRKFRSRFQASQTARSDDSIPAAASPVSRGSFKPQVLNPDEVISLTPIDVEPQFAPRQVSSFSTRAERRFRRPIASTASDAIPDSEGSAATVETSRPSLLPRGRSRFTISTTTEATAQPASVSFAQRRPTFARFTPRPFTRSPSSTASPDADDENTELPEETTTQRIALRLPFGRSRPTSTASPRIIARKLPFPSRQSTTQQTLSNNDDDDDDEPEGKSDDILLSESAREEKEHEEGEDTEEAPKRRVIIKKFRAPGAADNDTVSTESVPIDDSGKKRFRIVRRRPTSTTAAPEPVTTGAPTAPGPQRIRKIIRKKLKPAEDDAELTAKSVGSLNTFRSSTTEEFNYGEKTRPTTTTTEMVTEPIIEEVTEFYKEKKVKVDLQSENIEPKEEVTAKNIENEEEKQVEQTVEQTTTAPANIKSNGNIQTDELENTESSQETVTEAKSADTEQNSDDNSKTVENKESSDKSVGQAKIETDTKPETEDKPEVTVISEGKSVDLSENKETGTETDGTQIETTTASTTVSTTSSSRTRLPYRPRKKLYTPSTEASVPSTSRVFSRKYNPGVYTSPATADKPLFRPSVSTRRPFSSKLFTRKPFTPRTTQKFEDDEEYNDEELLEEDPESDKPFVFVPPNQLFTRKPDSEEEGEEGIHDEAANSEELLDEEEEGPYDDEVVDEDDTPTTFALTTKRPGFRPRVVNSNTFRASTSTTEITKRFPSSQNKTGIITRFSNKPAIDTKKRVQNFPPGYNSPVSALRPKGTGPIIIRNGTQEAEKEPKNVTTTIASITEGETTTLFDDDYLTDTSTTSTDSKVLTTFEDASTTNTDEMETATYEMEIDNSTDDYLESTEGTTNYPTTQDITTISQTEAEIKTTIVQNTVTYTVPNTETTTEPVPTTVPATTTTELAPPPLPIIKTQFDKLFSITRVVEVNSKLDKHHINKNNETTHIEEGKIMVEKKPVVDKIGEVSRFSLIKIVEDDIPIYLTKFGHIYPVEHPPENHIRIDEARNARALVETYPEIHRENLVASESVNEAYRHIKKVSDSEKADENKDHVEHLPSDDFLSYVNEENKTDSEHDGPQFATWQFVPAAYENEKVRAAKSFEIVTPRSMLTNPSTLSLEGLFETENPLMARKVNDDKNQPFLVYSASVPNQEEKANIVKISPLKPESGRSILTFAKGQEFNGGSADEVATVKNPIINISVLPQTSESSTVSPSSTTSTTISSTTPTTTTTKESPPSSSPIIDLLSTTQATTEVPTTTSTDTPSTTETVPDETTTVKISPLDAKRAKFGLPRRPIIKSSNFTRPSVAPRSFRKINATVTSNLNQKANKTTFSPSKSRFSANRVQNVPVDLKKKNNSPKVAKTFTTAKTYTTESPKTTTERKIYFKPIRPNFRPAFFPRKTTTPPVTGDT